VPTDDAVPEVLGDPAIADPADPAEPDEDAADTADTAAASAPASILPPQTLAWNLVRLAAAVGCLPWFIWSFNRARRWSDDMPPEGSKRGAQGARHGSTAGEDAPE